MLDDQQLKDKIDSFKQVYFDLTQEKATNEQIKEFLQSEEKRLKNKLISDAFSGQRLPEVQAMIRLLEPISTSDFIIETSQKELAQHGHIKTVKIKPKKVK